MSSAGSGADARAGAGGRENRVGGSGGVQDVRSVGNAVGRCRDPGLVWHGADGAEGFSGLCLGLDNAGRVGIDTREILVISVTRSELSGLRLVRSVVGAADTIVNVLAEVCCVCSCGVASLQAELTATHEVMPFNDLFEGVVIALAESGRVEQAAERVSTEVGSVRVKFASGIISGQVDLGLVNETNDLDVIRSPHELNTQESTRGNNTGTISGLGTPRHLELFGVTDSRWSTGRRPQTEVIDGIQVRSLAHGLLVLGSRVTFIVTGLRTTDTKVGISLIRKVGPVKMFRGQWNDRSSGGILGESF